MAAKVFQKGILLLSNFLLTAYKLNIGVRCGSFFSAAAFHGVHKQSITSSLYHNILWLSILFSIFCVFELSLSLPLANINSIHPDCFRSASAEINFQKVFHSIPSRSVKQSRRPMAATFSSVFDPCVFGTGTSVQSLIIPRHQPHKTDLIPRCRHSCMILLKILTFAYLQNPMKQITLSSPCPQELPNLPFSTQYTPISYCMLTKHLLMLSIIPKPHWESVGRIPST